MKRAIEAKQRELEALHSKLALPVDTDILRMKIAKDVEHRHRLELEAKQDENERLANSYYEAKRVSEVLKAQVESLKSEGDRELRDLKEKHRQEVQELTLENQALLSKAEDRRDRDLVRQLRRELDDSKRRCSELQSEAAELRKERDFLKLEKAEAQVKAARELEEARNERRVLEGEAERLKFKAGVAEEDRQKLMIKAEKRQAEVNACLLEKAQLQTLLRDKDQINDNLQK